MYVSALHKNSVGKVTFTPFHGYCPRHKQSSFTTSQCLCMAATYNRKTCFKFRTKEPLMWTCFHNWAHEAFVLGEAIYMNAYIYGGKKCQGITQLHSWGKSSLYFAYAGHYPFEPGFWRDPVEPFCTLNTHNFFRCTGPDQCTVLILQKAGTCEWNPSAVDDTNFLNALFKPYMGFEHCPKRRRGKHAALKLVLLTY